MAAVLCVDDCEVTLFLRRLLLEQVGHTVVNACSGEQALSMFQLAQFDVVLCDLHLPGQTGIEVAVNMRALRPGVPFVLVTGEINIDAGVPGVDAIFIKGGSPESLFATITGVLGSRKKQEKPIEPVLAMSA